MGILFKGAFWFSAVLLALPILDSGEETPDAPSAPTIEMAETLNAIGTAVADIRAICERHPDVCETGGETLAALGYRARDGARIAYEYLDASLADDAQTVAAAPSSEPSNALPADPISTGTVLSGLDPELAAASAELLAAGLSASAALPTPSPAPEPRID